MATLLTVFVVSLFGSLHCAGMCGPLVAFAVGATETKTIAGRISLQLLYHGGRLVTYTLIGAICGLLGAVIDLGGSLIGLNRAAAVLAGVMMIGVGIIAIARYSGMRLPKFSLPEPLNRAIAVGRKAALGFRPANRALVIGLLTALLPCGWLYAFAVVAAGTGSVLFGAGVMLAFWLGTVPILASLGVGVQALAGSLGRRIPAAMALVIVGLGLYTIVARPAISVEDVRPALKPAADSKPDELLESIQGAEMPCCHDDAEQPSSNPSPANQPQSSGGANDKVVCSHCSLPVPRGLVVEGHAEQFCCNGCRTVYEMIHGLGMDRFYRLRDNGDYERMPARTTDHRYAEFDDPAFAERYYQATEAEGTSTVELYLEGVHCMACVWLVEKLPKIVPGVVESRLDFRRSLIRVRWNDDIVKLSRVARTLDSLGYPPHPARDVNSREIRRREDHRFLIRLGVAAACAGNVMTLAFALYGGLFTGIEAQYSQLFRWTSMVFGVVSLSWPGSLFFRGAWAALRSRTAHLDLPIALALLAGGLAGTVNAIRGEGEIYFDSLTMLVFLLLLGRWIQRRQQRWSADALELLFSLTPSSARRVEEDGIREVPIEAVSAGDVLEVRAGDSVPADGTIIEGHTTVDQSLLTGESQSVSVSKSDPLHAGTVNLTDRVLVQVRAVGSQTRVGKLMQLVEECSRRQAPIVQFADRVAGWFVAVVLMLAVLTFAAWLRLDADRAVDHAVALLIVTCPCALGLATPLAMTVALGRAAKRQILIKGGEVFELLAGRGLIVLDKTGTVTAGRTSLVNWIGDTSIQRLVGALERHSAHAIAQTLVAAFETTDGFDLDSLEVVDCQQQAGAGLVGTVADRRVVVGTKNYLQAQQVQVAEELVRAEREAVRAGASPVLVGVDGRCLAVGWLDDPIRDDAAESVDRLRKAGWRIAILSGDHSDVVARVGERLQLPPDQVVGGASPEDKVAFVERAAVSTRVVMVGDGVNDAAALSAAAVGIAVHGGAEASLAAADVYLNRPGLSAIAELVAAARDTLRTIHRSLGISLVYNGVAASLAMAGLIGPLFAAILMPISSFTVLALAFFSPTFGEPA